MSNSDELDLRHLRVRQLFGHGEYDLAEADIQRILAIDPKSANAYFYLGKICEVRERIDEAAENYKKAFDLGATLLDSNIILVCKAETNKRHYSTVIQICSSVISRRTDIGIYVLNKLYLLRANATFMLGQYEQSLDDYNLALKQTSDPLALLRRGSIHYFFKRYSDALLDFKQALALNPRCIDNETGINLEDSLREVSRTLIYEILQQNDISFYHVTDKQNLESILRTGILPKNKLESEQVVYHDNSDTAVQQLRDERGGKQFSDGVMRPIHGAVPLYLKDMNYTIYRMLKSNPNMVLLQIDKEIVLDAQVEYCFSDGNASSEYTQFFSSFEELKSKIGELKRIIEYDKSEWKDWKNPAELAKIGETDHTFRRKSAAELLIYPKVDAAHISSVYECIDSGSKLIWVKPSVGGT